MMRYAILALLIFYVVLSCQKNREEAHQDYSKLLNAEVIEDIRLRYSDSAQLKAIITGPKLLRYSKENKETFPEGIHATFYSIDGTPNSQLKAGQAYRFPRKNKIIVEDHVILYNQQGDSLITSQLTWDEKKDKIYTNRFVRLTKRDRVILGYGFESNQDFTKGRIKAIQGTWKLDDDK